ncbi:hypothetical protein P3S67_022117 [Capsicum chacoense]
MAVIPLTTEGVYHFKMISLKVNIEKIDVLTSILRVEHHSTHYFRPADPKFHLRNGEASTSAARNDVHIEPVMHGGTSDRGLQRSREQLPFVG